MAVIAQEPGIPTQTHAEVTRDVVRTITDKPTTGYYILAGSMAALVLLCFGTFAALLKYGLGLAGYSPPIMWSVYITTFVFWIGIGHAGTLISAILFLFRSRWRTAVYRSTEAMTVFAVMTAGLFPIIHIGRQWIFYWLIPVSQPALPLAEFQVAAAVGRLRDLDLPDGVGDLPGHRAGARRGGGARPRQRVEEEDLRRAVARLDRRRFAVAALLTCLSLPGGARHAAGAVGALGGVLGLRDVDHPGLARDDLRSVLRRRRHLFRHRDGADADHPAAEGAPASST